MISFQIGSQNFYCPTCNNPRKVQATFGFTLKKDQSKLQLEPLGIIVNCKNFFLTGNVGSHSLPLYTQSRVLHCLCTLESTT